MNNEKLVLPCLRGAIGDWVYYSSLMTASQVAGWVKPVKDIRESKSLDDELQRGLHERQKSIAKYLLTDNSRFFNSIIVGVFDGMPDWLEFDLSKASGYIGSDAEMKQIKESVGLLILNGNEKMFAIDGQHRVAGISVAINESVEKLEFKEVLNDDQFSVIFVGHIDDDLGKKRTRKLFSDINKNARPVAGGDKIKIDEQDISAIVARRVYAQYPHFKQGSIVALTENANLDKGDVSNFTNLLGLYKVNKILRKLFKKIPKTYEWDETNVVSFQEIVTKFYDYIINNLPNYRAYFIESSLTLEETRKRNSYLLFRPIGLFLLARLYVYFHKRPDEKLDKVAKISFIMPDSPYSGVLWNNGSMEARSKNQLLAFNLTLYILGEQVDEETLLAQYRNILKNDKVSLPTKVK